MTGIIKSDVAIVIEYKEINTNNLFKKPKDGGEFIDI